MPQHPDHICLQRSPADSYEETEEGCIAHLFFFFNFPSFFPLCCQFILHCLVSLISILSTYALLYCVSLPLANSLLHWSSAPCCIVRLLLDCQIGLAELCFVICSLCCIICFLSIVFSFVFFRIFPVLPVCSLL